MATAYTTGRIKYEDWDFFGGSRQQIRENWILQQVERELYAQLVEKAITPAAVSAMFASEAASTSDRVNTAYTNLVMPWLADEDDESTEQLNNPLYAPLTEEVGNKLVDLYYEIFDEDTDTADDEVPE